MVELESGRHGQRLNSKEDVDDDVMEIVTDCLDAEDLRVGEYFVGRIEEIKDSILSDGLSIQVQTPNGLETWGSYKKPYAWNAETNFLVELAEARGYDKTNWHNLQGDEVLVKPTDAEDEIDDWSLISKTPTQRRAELLAESEEDDSTENESAEGVAENPQATPERENTSTKVADTDNDESHVRGAEEIRDECLSFHDDSINGYLPREITRIYEVDIEADDSLVVEVETPGGLKKWFFEMPYLWEDENPFVALAEDHGYGPANWTHLEGEEVLMKPPETGLDGEWILDTTPVEDYRQKIGDNSDEWNDDPEESKPKPSPDTEPSDDDVLETLALISVIIGVVTIGAMLMTYQLF